jgi:transcriptional regulator with XRE-family HTH domain
MEAARKHAKLTQTEAARRVGMIQGTLSGLEATAEGSTLVVKFAKVYGVSPYWLALGEGPMVLETVMLSPEALRVAQQIDALRNDPDPDRLKWALQMGELVFTERPRTAAQMVALVAALSGEPLPTAAPAPQR